MSGRPIPGLERCGSCGGLIGKCFTGIFRQIVKNVFLPDGMPMPPPDEWTYYDVDTVGVVSDRHHGWFHEPTGYILQTG